LRIDLHPSTAGPGCMIRCTIIARKNKSDHFFNNDSRIVKCSWARWAPVLCKWRAAAANALGTRRY
ncbi:MAG: hypothetical protein QNJ01_15375, partial [Desulfobacterales bacterium]|nr:hypothetical protein [Desulfobacterales bacterium]